MGPICQLNTPSLRGALATKQSTLSLCGGMDCFAALAKTWMGPSANTILRHCEELLRRSNPYFLCGGMDCFAEPVIGRAFARPVGSQRRGWGPSANTILRHCEELLRRSNPRFSFCVEKDCLADPLRRR